jgi:hypothetical protein
MKLLPPAYGEIARNELLEYFPEDFVLTLMERLSLTKLSF